MPVASSVLDRDGRRRQRRGWAIIIGYESCACRQGRPFFEAALDSSGQGCLLLSKVGGRAGFTQARCWTVHVAGTSLMYDAATSLIYDAQTPLIYDAGTQDTLAHWRMKIASNVKVRKP